MDDLTGLIFVLTLISILPCLSVEHDSIKRLKQSCMREGSSKISLLMPYNAKKEALTNRVCFSLLLLANYVWLRNDNKHICLSLLSPDKNVPHWPQVINFPV
jgi:hypothetical protein